MKILYKLAPKLLLVGIKIIIYNNKNHPPIGRWFFVHKTDTLLIRRGFNLQNFKYKTQHKSFSTITVCITHSRNLIPRGLFRFF